MAEWIKVSDVGDPASGEVKVVRSGDLRIALANVDGKYFAVDDVCTHDGGPLGQGDVFDYEIECPRHGARFDIRTGQPMCLPAILPVKTYAVRVEGNEVQIEL